MNLISELHHTAYYINHLDRAAHAVLVIIVKLNIKHYILQSYTTNKIQTTIVKLEAFAYVKLLWLSLVKNTKTF